MSDDKMSDDKIVSLSERRALAGGDSRAWSPRDLLAHLLSEIDAGKLPAEGIVVCYFWHQDGGTITGMRRSKATIMESVAMVEMAKHDLLR